MNGVIRVRVLAALGPEDSRPDIVGCIDEAMWEIEGQEETDARWARMKKDFGPHSDEYTWREIVVEIPEHQMMRYFNAPVVSARVDISEPTVEA